MATDSEIDVYDLLCSSLFEEFVYLSPKVQDGRELADALVFFDRTLVIVQVKMPDASAHAHKSLAKREAWARKNADSAHRQIGRTWTYITSGQAAPVQNRRNPDRPLHPSTVEHVVGVAVVGEDPLPLDATQVNKAGRSIPVLTVNLPQFRTVTSFLDTAPDFVDAVYAMTDVSSHIAQETGSPVPTKVALAALATYFDPALTMETRASLARNDPEGVWLILSRAGGVAERRRDEFRNSYLIDHMLRRMHECEGMYDEVRRDWGSDRRMPVRSQWRELVTTFASLNRSQRQVVGAAMADLFRKVDRSGQPVYRIMCFDDWARPLAFLVLTDGSLHERQVHLAALTQTAAAVYETDEMLGVCTDVQGTSFQFCQVDGPISEVPEPLKSLAEDLRRLRFGSVPVVNGLR